jgi:hypothetical protein
MSSLVEELQRDALNPNIAVTEILRKCLVVATKLGIEEFASWARLELDGYKEREVPEYRIILGTPKVLNPYHGYQPIFFEDPVEAEFVSKMFFNQPIGEIEHSLVHSNRAGPGVFHVAFSPANEKILIEMMQIPMKPSLEVSGSQLHRIIDAVRNIILKWSIKLESDGILGDEMSFSREEKEKAHSITYNIKNYIQGQFDHSQIQLESVNSVQKGSFQDLDLVELRKIITSLKGALDGLELERDVKDELIAEIRTLESQTDSPKPKASILRESLISVRKILESAAGNLLASGLLSQISILSGP